jgi:CHASE2 domain-containing sensor protein
MIKYLCLAFLLVNYGCKSQDIQKQIVLVNIDTLSRNGISKVISLINKANPKVVAIDLHFVDDRGSEDLFLINTLNECRELIMSSVINNLGNGVVVVSNMSSTQFMPEQSKTGFVNVLQEEDEFKTVKRFIVFQKAYSGKLEYHFAIRVAMSYDSVKAMGFIKEHNSIAEIDYKKGRRKFRIISSVDMFSSKIAVSEIAGKIVIIGFLGPGNEDRFRTPLNSSKDPSESDMYGAEYLANIVAQVLE